MDECRKRSPSDDFAPVRPLVSPSSSTLEQEPFKLLLKKPLVPAKPSAPFLSLSLLLPNKTKPTTLTPLTTTGSSLRRLLVANYPFSTFCLSGYCLKEKGPFSTSRLSGYCLKVKGKSKLSIQYLSPFGVLSESERLIHKSTSPQVQKLKS